MHIPTVSTLFHQSALLFLMAEPLHVRLFFLRAGIEIEDDGTNDPADFKFARWLTKEKVIFTLEKYYLSNEFSRILARTFATVEFRVRMPRL